MLRKFSTILSMPREQRLLALEAHWALARARIKVLGVPVRNWRGTLEDEAGPAVQDAAMVAAIGLEIERAARNLPGTSKCLPLALAARTMLSRRSIASELMLGVRRSEAGIPAFHAWLKVGDTFVTGACDESEYSPLTRAAQAAS